MLYLWLWSKSGRPRSLEPFNFLSKASNIHELTSTWNPDQQDVLIATAADNVDVEKIFVAPAIKKHFCEKYPASPWLFKLRAFDGHDDHIHVRLKVPAHGSTTLGTGPIQCGAELEPAFDGWEVTVKGIDLPPYRPEFPALPKECESVLHRTAAQTSHPLNPSAP